ncbi:DUF4249 domain-containing protein [Ginsengibacter hankyongi]|uniref:DUF4249 domain-containing protein n=1 Tax=Ginsengibacter hankyongi TaxID=2607284 RepID=A0A5J5IJM7_9BACT|nr:DUF4249 domain-containing protein [Ginsengibacter hankyongi]KAA9041249.1 DUF4249 domain-containing protein [Ginsengibacter hankyongi]
MKQLRYFIILSIICTGVYLSCRKPYSPPAISVDHRFLVIDGTLINSADSPSIFALSRTVKLTDSTFASSPETGATLSVEGENGDIHHFSELPGGFYRSAPIVLNPSSRYRLNITTFNGKQYSSDYVAVKQAPPIDSVTWQQQNDVMIYLDTHDPSNATKYYRWDFTETYQYEAPLNAELSQDHGNLYYVDNTPNQTFDCWRTVNSTDILLGSSVALSQDVISDAPVTIVPQNSQKISLRYSILVKQYALTEDAYQYFSILKKNTENLGSIFDAQPTQLTGNIHSVKNPGEVVIGFFSASSVTQKRLFITKNEVSNWHFVDTNLECGVKSIGHFALPDPRFFVWNYPDTAYYPYYFCGSSCLMIARRECVDCRVRGGTNQKPLYW